MNSQVFWGSSAGLLIAAFVLDLTIGDPRWLPHPVVSMGKVISHGEALLRTGKPRRDFLAGMALSFFVMAISASTAWALVALFHWLAFWLSFIAISALASTTLATRGLLDAARRIEAPLRAGDLMSAREKLSQIVGRETAHLNQDKVLRASLESLAESTCDGIVAPLFYLFVGGVPLAMAYKAVCTLGCMIGYRTERYFYFGKFAARLDDVFNFLPARLTALVMIVVASLLKLRARLAAKVVWRDHAKHLSPN